MNPEAQILDMLIIGAGPTGTAAAFRAQELAVSSYTIDYDDVIRRIRDYSKDKLICPTSVEVIECSSQLGTS